MTEIIEKPDERLAALAAKVVEYFEAAKSPATRAAYKKDWENFTTWCKEHNLQPLPATPPTIALYIAWMAEQGRKVASITRAMTTIRQSHLSIGEQPPTSHPAVGDVLNGIKRKLGTDQKKARPLLLEQLRKVVARIPPSFLGKRDKAILLLGWSAAMRRSEIVALNVEDIEFMDEGCSVTIRKSKTDQFGEGITLGIPWGRDKKFCPTTALQDWIDTAELDKCLFPSLGTPGKLFAQLDLLNEGRTEDLSLKKRLTGRTVNTILARRMQKAGYRPKGYSGNSLRAGFITSAARAKIPEYLIQRHSRHRSVKVLRGYIREEIFSDNLLHAII